MEYWCEKRMEWMGCWVAGIIIASDDWDHSRKFPAFSTSKNINELISWNDYGKFGIPSSGRSG